jgi:ATP-dependent exoDNAse (exonuclease V) alpha subunit
MQELLRIAEQRSARIIFGGDTKQIQSVEACDALRVLEKESRLKSVSLTQVRRLREPVRAEHFSHDAGSQIVGIAVRRME